MAHPPIQVLQVEDNPADARLIREALAQSGSSASHGFELTGTNRLRSALDLLGQVSFSVVLLDLTPPDSHDLETYERVRAASANLPIVVVTSRTATKHKEHARALGASEYLTKPFTPETLAAAIEKWGRVRKTEAS